MSIDRIRALLEFTWTLIVYLIIEQLLIYYDPEFLHAFIISMKDN